MENSPIQEMGVSATSRIRRAGVNSRTCDGRRPDRKPGEDRGLRPSYAFLAAALLLLQLAATDASAQTADTTRTITFAAPRSGVIYIRSGEPGGVRIRSVHGARPRSSEPGGAGGSTALNPADLTRLEAILARQGLDLDVGFARRNGLDVVVLRRRGDRSGEPADTLSLPEAARLLGTLGGDQTVPGSSTAQSAAPRAGIPPLDLRIERSLLDEGLFRSLRVNFEFDQSELLPTSGPTLDAVAAVLERLPDVRIEVGGHTDSVGPDAYNEQLSSRRADEVRRALIGRGIRPDRVRGRGFGESQPVLSNRTPTGRAMNRRVEFVLLNPEALEPERSDTRQTEDESIDRLRQSIREGIREAFDDGGTNNE